MQKHGTSHRARRRSAELPNLALGAGSPQLAARTAWKRRLAVALGLGALAFLGWYFLGPRMRKPAPPVIRHEVIAAHPHAVDAFSQGLVYEDGVLYEGTGGYGASSLRKVELATGRIIQQVDLAPDLFGEGIAVVGDEIYQLTWRSRVGFVYDKKTFRKLREFKYTGEGWGLAYDGRHLVMSDGTDTLRFFDPRTFREARRLRVTSGGRRLYKLNELEYADGFLYANLWHADYIVKISPQTGAVAAWIDMRGLLPNDQRRDAEAVLNGIAYDASNGRFFVTGKNWPTLFEVRFVDAAPPGQP